MRRKPIGADLGTPFEARHDHEPADRTLRAAEDEQCRQPQAIAFGNRALEREPGDADEKDEAENAAEQAMDPLPEENELEAAKSHSGRPGHLAKLRRLLVEA